MSQFQINRNLKYDNLDTFARGYIEAMFFTNGDTGDDNEYLLNELGTERLTRAALNRIKFDCNAFLSSIEDGLFVRQHLDAAAQGEYTYDDAQAGRDFWFTRQGHGVGFWDRKELSQYHQDVLTRAAKARGNANIYVSRGWIHHDL